MRVSEEFSSIFSRVNNSTRKRGISIARLFCLIGGASNYVLTFATFTIIVLPLPLPPGCSTVLAIPAIFITTQIVCETKKIWIPRVISNIRLSKNLIRRIDITSRKYISKADKITKRRLSFLASRKLNRIYNLLLFVLALLSAVPIPFVCVIPAFAGIILSIGLVVKDGLLIVLGLLISFTGMVSVWFTLQALLTIKNLFL